MVFFTCNICGESLKKKDVEKHCNTRCRGGPFLTCVDCLKDFREDFVKHTVCVTEDDRYSANGLKGIQSKQKSKQQQWVEVVQETVSKTIDDGVSGLTPSIRSLLLWLQDQPTLPDKAKPFTNFIKNARRSEPLQNIEFVWKILEEARKDFQAKLTAEREAAEAEKRKAKQLKLQQKQESSDSSDSDSSTDETDLKPKRNGKKEKSSEPQTSHPKEESKKDKKKKRMVSESESVVNGTSELRKTKKSKKNPEGDMELENTSNLNNAMDACHLTTQDTIEEEKKLSKKEKKEKKKREKYEAEMKSMESAETAEVDANDEEEQEPSAADIDEKPEGKKGKKKKNKKKNENANEDVVEQPTEEKEKKKKKKNKHEAEEPMDTSEKSGKKSKTGLLDNGKLNETLNMEDLERTKFSWDQTILQVLEAQSDKEISFKKLSKKVCNEYVYSLGDSCYEDENQIMTKFQKKLHKMHNVLVLKDRVKLKTSRD
ncbi:hypothetical protein FOCC_FOCC013629 [Frankliniella occidentalis]|uniref:Cell growth-regulating nucleolar protein n=1 Tax=Frankliniella occidentalis TaxID=133901 RepID=A0A6J1SXR8_FRAOC|nr:cell growth-regulating nucleolar protein [Frankliniella occidentalis]KAE8740837.1 hypothetical protein FOCC_FOCC013629 [Frankliniella occidentalis]